ncbi:MAG: DNA polymerase III subunit chi [Hyphomicrobiaceae bacterium]
MSDGEQTEVLFYQLDRQPLDRVLPALLERTLERGWRAVVQAGSVERIDALDTELWTYDEASFLPHGTDRAGDVERQPILLTVGDNNPNGASVRFLVDGASIEDFSGYRRIVHLFETSEEALAKARREWKLAKEKGAVVTYWQQDAKGRWEKRA